MQNTDAMLAFYRRLGFEMRESAAAVVEYAMRDLGLTRLVAIVSPENRASISVLEDLGLRFEKTTKLTPEGKDIQLFGRAL